MKTIKGIELKELKKNMVVVELKKIYDCKVGKRVEFKEPNITKSVFFSENGEIIGFYLKPDDIPVEVRDLATLVNNELLTDNIPKQVMSRVFYINGKEKRIKQFSTIVGAVRPEVFKRRYKPGLSHIHLVDTAQKYIKYIKLWARFCGEMVKELTPELYKKQKELLEPQKMKIGDLWTSSIANFNGAVNTHIDGANIKGANNIIYFKRNNSKGGNLHIPEYGGVVNSVNDSLVFYPAYKHIHGVDDIIPFKQDGYRNSLVLYPLNIKWK